MCFKCQQFRREGVGPQDILLRESRHLDIGIDRLSLIGFILRLLVVPLGVA